MLATGFFLSRLISRRHQDCTIMTFQRNLLPPSFVSKFSCVLNMKGAMSLVIILVDLQLDAYNSYLFTYNTFIKILYLFRALPCSYSGGLRHNCIYAASGIVIL